MPNDLTPISKTSKPVSLYSASNSYLDAALNSRCDQTVLIDALRTLLGLYYQPNETSEERARQIASFVADLSEQQTAEALGIPVGTVKSRTARAIEQIQSSDLREELS